MQYLVRNLFDNNVQTKYCTNVGNGQDSAVEITFTLSKGASLSGYVFCTANDTADYSDRNPRSWVLYGKASGGNWVEIDACDGAAMGLEATNYTCYGRFCNTSTNADVYTDYKLVISHRELLQLSDIVLFGDKLN